ncbi:MAG: type II secretion system protein [Thermoguttaceae bacterium]|nr:type II secretion system protein [Thermoguttaceae bacterium]
MLRYDDSHKEPALLPLWIGPLQKGFKMKTGSKPVFGSTLVELLVVISTISILLGLVIPAVQAVRRAKCAGDLRQAAAGRGERRHRHAKSIAP